MRMVVPWRGATRRQLPQGLELNPRRWRLACRGRGLWLGPTAQPMVTLGTLQGRLAQGESTSLTREGVRGSNPLPPTTKRLINRRFGCSSHVDLGRRSRTSQELTDRRERGEALEGRAWDL